MRRLLANDRVPIAHVPLRDQPVEHVGVERGELFGRGAVAEDEDRPVERVSVGAREADAALAVPLAGEVEEGFDGYSLGKWVDENKDGKFDVLEVETRYFKGPRYFDLSGIQLHEDNETVIKERIYLDKADRNTLYDQITVFDHAMTRPYSKIQKAVRNPNPRPSWHSDTCSEDNTWVKIGKDSYYVSADGKLMPAKNDQAPPDLRYFKQTQK